MTVPLTSTRSAPRKRSVHRRREGLIGGRLTIAGSARKKGTDRGPSLSTRVSASCVTVRASMRTIAVPLLCGLMAGALGGFMGVGGGILLVPLLVHALGLGQHEAQGTSLAFTTVTALVAATLYFRQGNTDLPLAFYLALGAVLGVLVGAA